MVKADGSDGAVACGWKTLAKEKGERWWRGPLEIQPPFFRGWFTNDHFLLQYVGPYHHTKGFPAFFLQGAWFPGFPFPSRKRNLLAILQRWPAGDQPIDLGIKVGHESFFHLAGEKNVPCEDGFPSFPTKYTQTNKSRNTKYAQKITFTGPNQITLVIPKKVAPKNDPNSRPLQGDEKFVTKPWWQGDTRGTSPSQKDQQNWGPHLWIQKMPRQLEMDAKTDDHHQDEEYEWHV